MKRRLSQVFVLLACASAAWPSAPLRVTTIQELRALSKNQVDQALPVELEATVTFYRSQVHDLFVQNGNQGVFIETTTTQQLAPGDVVRIKGTTHWGYHANVASNDITVVSHQGLPAPVPATFAQLVKGQTDSMLVTVRGVVHAADMSQPSDTNRPAAVLKVLTEGGYIWAEVRKADAASLSKLLDAEVEITGVDGGKFDGKMQLTGVALRVNSISDVKVVIPAAVSPWGLPATPIDRVLSASNVKDETRRVLVSGTITYFEPGTALVLQSGGKSIWAMTASLGPAQVGDRAQVTGFPGVNNGNLVLTGSEFQDSGVHAPIIPDPVKVQDLRASRHIYDLVSIEGEVVMEAREPSQDEYLLTADGQIFSAIYSHRLAADSLPPMKDIPVGSVIRVTGICTTNDDNPFNHEVPFNVLIRSTDDLALVASPSVWSARNLTILLVIMLLSILGVGARALWVGFKMRRQVAELGYLSQRRGEILEDINRSEPLSTILERITELASATLKGAPCWCQVGEGPAVGNCPADLDSTGLRTVEFPISAHSGQKIGSIYAAFDARTKSRPDELHALATAADIATLAIETSRLHSDLVHRSEFDMLTEIQNRFAFERCLEELISDSHRATGMFALIYIDLNDFKQVNDRYGHQAGDLFLQKVAERMKHQLRPSDMLARLGGDEFGILITAIHSRKEAEDIARRLDGCFSEPFTIKNHIVTGSASIGIAVYPTDGVTEDTLMSIADSAMYVRKRMRPRAGDRRVSKTPESLIGQSID
jgi:diguanylate cyclase (GGDEF)-like protein